MNGKNDAWEDFRRGLDGDETDGQGPEKPVFAAVRVAMRERREAVERASRPHGLQQRHLMNEDARLVREHLHDVRPHGWLESCEWSDSPEMRRVWPFVRNYLIARATHAATDTTREHAYCELFLRAERPRNQWSYKEGWWPVVIPVVPAEQDRECFLTWLAFMDDLQSRLQQQGFSVSAWKRDDIDGYAGNEAEVDIRSLLRVWSRDGLGQTALEARAYVLKVTWDNRKCQ